MGQGTRYPSYDTPYEQSYPSYDNHFAEPVDLDALDSPLRHQRPARSIARREEFFDDSVPLFLSGADEEHRSPKFGRPRKKGSSRLLKTGAFVVAATIATFVAVKNPFTVFANATASLIGGPDIRSAAAPAAPPSNPTAAAVPSLAAVAATNASQAPSRDEIALALKTAHQNLAPVEMQQPATVATVAPVIAAPPMIRRLGTDELATLMTRGKALLASGDIPPARLLLERAAEAGEASAALILAQTYDPGVLGTQDTRNITPDPALARNWYQRAAQLGSADAQRRLSQLQ
jgi:TPR repeat protein